ncbi:F-box protein At3g17320 isoform X2 [Capsella rubella]|uniref:F-box protein At3g17320 isoform X2 n=1 Tax=Capsella rubella TaxID=81985 RepID=UPI000CD4C62C|nr:F-box protein At3g17320 isoform X2 [Capsella rubella]
MTKICDLPRDLAEEVLSRLPVTSPRALRFTCKKWNTLSKCRSFTKKQIGREQAEAKKKKQEKAFQAIMTMNYKVYLMSVNLDGIHKDDDNVQSSIKQKARWIEPRDSYCRDSYALGYEMKNNVNRSYKILRCVNDFKDMSEMSIEPRTRICEFEIYNFDSHSWKSKTVKVTPNDWDIFYGCSGVSVKGNTYWFVQERIPPLEEIPIDVIDELREAPSFLICFDFTTEKFGSRLPLPFPCLRNDTVTLSSVGEEKLAVLYHRWDSMYTKIWISNKIDQPNALSWSELFLNMGKMRPLEMRSATFFVDEEKKLAVVFDKGKSVYNPTCNTAYIVGEDGYSKQVDLGESVDKYLFPRVYSYVPSCEQI